MTVKAQQVKGMDMRPEGEGAYDDPEILEKVSKNLQEVESEIEPADSTLELESEISEPADSTPESKSEETPVLPESLLRAAVHQGWTQEEVQEFFEENPDKALKTFEKIYESTNRLSQRYAQLGRVQPKTQVEQTKPETPVYEGLDIKKIREEHGNDPIVDLLEQQDKVLKSLLSKPIVSQPVQTQVQNNTFFEDQMLWSEINQFFGDGSMIEYKDVYGPGKINDWGRNLTPGQRTNRMAVLERAEQILTGAEIQGESMSVQEALNLAHLLITEPIREQVIRSNIKASVSKRSKGITLKPSDSKHISDSDKPKSDAELETRTEERLAKVFGS